jgi:uncharacterized integral membrane protein
MTSSNQPPDRPPGGKPQPRFTTGQVVGAVLLVLALIFIFENTKRVSVRLVIPEVRLPLFVALLIAALCGSGITLLLQYQRRRRK